MRPDGPGQSARLLSDVVVELQALKVRYAVIGALAASFHGVVRASLDADAVIAAGGDPDLVTTLISRLRDREWRVEHRRGDWDDPVDSVVVTDRLENRVDLLTGIRGMPADSLSRTVAVPALGGTFQIIGVEDFIVLKLLAGSPKDLDDARGVMQVSAESLDWSLLERLVAGCGSDAVGRFKELKRDP